MGLIWGIYMNRDEAIAILKEIAKSEGFTLDWISLINAESGCEIHIKADGTARSIIEPIFKSHRLKMKEKEDKIILYKEH